MKALFRPETSNDWYQLMFAFVVGTAAAVFLTADPDSLLPFTSTTNLLLCAFVVLLVTLSAGRFSIAFFGAEVIVVMLCVTLIIKAYQALAALAANGFALV